MIVSLYVTVFSSLPCIFGKSNIQTLSARRDGRTGHTPPSVNAGRVHAFPVLAAAAA